MKNWPVLVLAVVLSAGFTGCSTLPSTISAGGLFSEQSSDAVAAPGSQPLYMVDMQMPFNNSKQFKGTIAPGGTVQSALEESGAVKKFRSMSVSVMRKVEGEYKPLKMACEYDSTIRSVIPETDYALRHGDRIVVTPKQQNSGLLQMLGTFGESKR